MNNVQSVGSLSLKNQPIIEKGSNNKTQKVSFKAENDQFVRQNRPKGAVYTQPAIIQQQDPLTKMMEERQKAEKKEKRRNALNIVAIGASIAAAAAIIYSVVRGQGGGVKKEIVKAIEACDIPALKKAALDEYAKGPHMCSEKKIKDLLALADVTKAKPGDIDLKKALQIMDEKIVDMPEIKEQVSDFLVKQAYNTRKGIKNTKPLVLCLDGPAGTGKTTVSEVMAEALDMRYKKISLGGTTGTSVIKGTESKFVGSEAGGIAKGQIENRTNRVLYCLDEVDKLGKSEQHGSAESALLSLFDDQAKFADDFLGTELDISNSIFVLTTNDVNKLSTPLKNRLKIMTIAPYGVETKTKIAKMHFDKLIKEAKADDIITIKDDAYRQIAEMTNDQGGRRTVANAKELVEKITVKDQLGEIPVGEKIVVDADFVKKNLTFNPKEKGTPERIMEAIAEQRMKPAVAEAAKETTTATVNIEAVV